MLCIRSPSIISRVIVNITLRVYRPSHVSFECIGGASSERSGTADVGADRSARQPQLYKVPHSCRPSLSNFIVSRSWPFPCTANKSDPFPQSCHNYKCKNKNILQEVQEVSISPSLQLPSPSRYRNTSSSSPSSTPSTSDEATSALPLLPPAEVPPEADNDRESV